MIRSVRLTLSLLLGAAGGAPTLGVAQVQPPAPVLAVDFSRGLEGWRRQRLDRRSTEYRVVQTDHGQVLASASRGSAGALVMPLPDGPTQVGRVSWAWSVHKSLTENVHEREKRGDDYAARVMVLFGDVELSERSRAIAYSWAGNEPVGSIYPNPSLSQVRTIVLRSGDVDAGRWIAEERDVEADYRAAFGEPAPPVAAIAIVVDTDDTGANAHAWFDDLKLFATDTTGAGRDVGRVIDPEVPQNQASGMPAWTSSPRFTAWMPVSCAISAVNGEVRKLRTTMWAVGCRRPTANAAWRFVPSDPAPKMMTGSFRSTSTSARILRQVSGSRASPSTTTRT